MTISIFYFYVCSFYHTDFIQILNAQFILPIYIFCFALKFPSWYSLILYARNGLLDFVKSHLFVSFFISLGFCFLFSSASLLNFEWKWIFDYIFFLCTSQPVGVVGAITPWNFPLAMITRKVCFELIRFILDNGPYLIFKDFKTCPPYICFVFKTAVWVCVWAHIRLALLLLVVVQWLSNLQNLHHWLL